MLKRREFLKLSSLGCLSVLGTSSLSFAEKEKKIEVKSLNKGISKYDKNGNLIYWKDDLTGYEVWNTCDEKGNFIYQTNSDGNEWWYKFDENCNEVYSKFSSKFLDISEHWGEYDKNNNLIYKKYKKTSLVMEYWYKYDELGRKVKTIIENTYK